MTALDRRFVYDLQKRRRKSMIALTASFVSQGSPCHRKKKGEPQFHVQVLTVVIRTVQLFHFYLSHSPDSFKCSVNVIRQ